MRAQLASVLVTVPAAAAAMVPATVSAGATAATTRVAPYFDQQVLFKAADEQGYSCFRIPATVRGADGTLLAFA